jgi:signal transduction histidine kinase
MDAFRRSDGLSGDLVTAAFEDREGNVWVATLDGLDRFRELPIPTVSVQQGLSTTAVWSVLSANDGSVWLATSDGLNRWRDGQITAYRKQDGLPADNVQSLFEDNRGRVWVSTHRGVAYLDGNRFTPVDALPAEGEVWSMVGDRAGNIWISYRSKGLFHLGPDGAVESTPWAKLSQNGSDALALLHDSRRGGVWLGFRSGGVAHFKDGQIDGSYTTADGLGEGLVSALRFWADGTLWAATQGGLSRVTDGRVATLTSKNGLPCDTVHWMMEDGYGSVWLYTACGLVRIARPDVDMWVADPNRIIKGTVLDESDGVRSRAGTSTHGPLVAKCPDGRIWFLPLDGVSVLDPRNLSSNKLPPPVHIESVFANDRPYPIKPGMRLPANVRSLRIEYTALSLVAPETMHFKYKLEGQGRNWHEVINERQATYTNIAPKSYRFRVIACNNSDVWNETGDSLEFSIAPAWNQTTWFYASCVAAFLAMLWGLYRLRLYQIRREFNAQLDGRVDERLRVARELHDTMLQSFQAALIQMQAAYNIFTRRPEKTGESLEKAINTAAGAIAEGRSAIQDLRLHPAGGGDLAQLLTTAGQELARSEEVSGNPPVFGVTVEGARRDVEPLIQDEVYRIARELLRNAFRHAQAGRIEVEVRYDSRQLRLHVRDDGKGIDSEVLKAGGRAGHYGLPGMRERANRFGGKLDFWSEAGAGTEAVLTVPAAVAYGPSNGGRFSFLRRKLWIHER